MTKNLSPFELRLYSEPLTRFLLQYFEEFPSQRPSHRIPLKLNHHHENFQLSDLKLKSLIAHHHRQLEQSSLIRPEIIHDFHKEIQYKHSQCQCLQLFHLSSLIVECILVEIAYLPVMFSYSHFQFPD